MFGQGRRFFSWVAKKLFQTSARAREPDPGTSLKVRKRLPRGRGRKDKGLKHKQEYINSIDLTPLLRCHVLQVHLMVSRFREAIGYCLNFLNKQCVATLECGNQDCRVFTS